MANIELIIDHVQDEHATDDSVWFKCMYGSKSLTLLLNVGTEAFPISNSALKEKVIEALQSATDKESGQLLNDVERIAENSRLRALVAFETLDANGNRVVLQTEENLHQIIQDYRQLHRPFVYLFCHLPADSRVMFEANAISHSVQPVDSRTTSATTADLTLEQNEVLHDILLNGGSFAKKMSRERQVYDASTKVQKIPQGISIDPDIVSIIEARKRAKLRLKQFYETHEHEKRPLQRPSRPHGTKGLGYIPSSIPSAEPNFSTDNERNIVSNSNESKWNIPFLYAERQQQNSLAKSPLLLDTIFEDRIWASDVALEQNNNHQEQPRRSLDSLVQHRKDPTHEEANAYSHLRKDKINENNVQKLEKDGCDKKYATQAPQSRDDETPLTIAHASRIQMMADRIASLKMKQTQQNVAAYLKTKKTHHRISSVPQSHELHQVDVRPSKIPQLPSLQSQVPILLKKERDFTRLNPETLTLPPISQNEIMGQHSFNTVKTTSPSFPAPPPDWLPSEAIPMYAAYLAAFQIQSLNHVTDQREKMKKQGNKSKN